MQRTILNHTIQPARFSNTPTDGSAAAAPVVTPPAGGEGADNNPEMGSSFQRMMAKMRDDGGAAGDDGTGAPPPPKPPDAPAKPAAKDKGKGKERPPGSNVPDAALADPPPGGTQPPPAAPPAGTGTEPAPDAELEAQTKGMSDAAKTNWKTLRASYDTKIKALETEKESLKKERDTLAAKVPAPEAEAEVANLRKERDELMQTVERLGLERSPKFTKEFVEGRRALVDSLAKKIADAGGDAEAFKHALKLSGKAKYQAIEEALGEMPGFMQTQVASGVTEIERLDERRDATLQDASKSLNEWEGAERSKRIAAMEAEQAARKNDFGEITKAISKDFVLLREIPADAPGAKEWNEARAGIVDRAGKFLFNASSFQDFATAAIAAETAPMLQNMFLAERKLRMALQQELEEITGTDPGSGSKSGTSQTPPAAGDQPAGLAARYAQAQKGGDE